MGKEVTKRDITEGIMLFVSFVVLTTMRYICEAGTVGLIGMFMIIIMTIYWICGIKKFSMIEDGKFSGTSTVMFGLSAIYKILIMTSVVFRYWSSYDGHQAMETAYGLIYIVGKLLLLMFVFSVIIVEFLTKMPVTCVKYFHNFIKF